MNSVEKIKLPRILAAEVSSQYKLKLMLNSHDFVIFLKVLVPMAVCLFSHVKNSTLLGIVITV